MGYYINREIRIVIDENSLNNLIENGSIAMAHPNGEGIVRVVYTDEDLEAAPEEDLEAVDDRSIR